ncbi:MAG: PH domain-containing protein [Planctomycetes bacterium]|nr:PH domain-containing protein [Planctomycetota bacterium]
MHTQRIDARQLLLVAAVFALGAMLLAGWTPLSPTIATMFGSLTLAFGVLAIWDVAATRYEFTANELVIHGGATRQRIRYDTIEAVRLARGLLGRLTSPNSVRLSVGARTAGVIALCPRDRDQFLRDLMRAVPWVAVVDR